MIDHFIGEKKGNGGSCSYDDIIRGGEKKGGENEGSQSWIVLDGDEKRFKRRSSNRGGKGKVHLRSWEKGIQGVTRYAGRIKGGFMHVVHLMARSSARKRNATGGKKSVSALCLERKEGDSTILVARRKEVGGSLYNCKENEKNSTRGGGGKKEGSYAICVKLGWKSRGSSRPKRGGAIFVGRRGERQVLSQKGNRRFRWYG